MVGFFKALVAQLFVFPFPKPDISVSTCVIWQQQRISLGLNAVFGSAVCRRSSWKCWGPSGMEFLEGFSSKEP